MDYKLHQMVPRIAELVVRHTGSTLSEQAQEELVLQLASLCQQYMRPGGIAAKEGRNRVIVSAVGKNRPGIVAAISHVLASCKADIVDINQTLVQDNFAMIMVVDLGEEGADFGSLKDGLQKVANELGIQVFAQHEEIFRSMQRI